MTASDPIFAVNAPRVIHESFGDETVVIDTETGVFFNLAGSGPLIFELLQGGCDRATLSNRVAGHCGVPVEEVRGAVDGFLDELLAESIVAAADAPATAASPAPLPPAAHSGWAAPTLVKYTDMSELLLVDPIHDLDDQGWPQRP